MTVTTSITHVITCTLHNQLATSRVNGEPSNKITQNDVSLNNVSDSLNTTEYL